MNRRTLGSLVLVVGLPAIAYAQGGQRAAVTDVAPVAATPVEAKVLQVLDRMVANRELYQAVDTANGRMLRLLVETTAAKHVVEIGTSTAGGGPGCLRGGGVQRPLLIDLGNNYLDGYPGSPRCSWG
jgi:hypothetical protein